MLDTLTNRKTALTAREVATLLNVSPDMIYKHAKQGRIPSFKVGSYVRFDPKVLATWLREKLGKWLVKK